jgi:predicted 3-demethylubiquinone-9 3-methyltransferase (glyoxalase superfamily)
MQKITPFLWFDNQAEEAMNFYVSVFKNSKHVSITRYGEAGPGAKGTVMTARFLSKGRSLLPSMAARYSRSLRPYRLS